MDICDALRNHSGKLSAIRGATAPPRNTFSHANRTRNPKMMEQLLWKTIDHLQTISPSFGGRSRYAKLPKRFKRLIHAVDSTTITLVLGKACLEVLALKKTLDLHRFEGLVPCQCKKTQPQKGCFK